VFVSRSASCPANGSKVETVGHDDFSDHVCFDESHNEVGSYTGINSSLGEYLGKNPLLHTRYSGQLKMDSMNQYDEGPYDSQGRFALGNVYDMSCNPAYDTTDGCYHQGSADEEYLLSGNGTGTTYAARLYAGASTSTVCSLETLRHCSDAQDRVSDGHPLVKNYNESRIPPCPRRDQVVPTFHSNRNAECVEDWEGSTTNNGLQTCVYSGNAWPSHTSGFDGIISDGGIAAQNQSSAQYAENAYDVNMEYPDGGLCFENDRGDVFENHRYRNLDMNEENWAPYRTGISAATTSSRLSAGAPEFVPSWLRRPAEDSSASPNFQLIAG